MVFITLVSTLTAKLVSKAAMAPYTVSDYVHNLTVQLSHLKGPLSNNTRIGVSSFYFADALDTKLMTQQASAL